MRDMKQRIMAVCLTGLLVTTGLFGCGRRSDALMLDEVSALEEGEAPAEGTEADEEGMQETDAPGDDRTASLYVYVCGHVAAPGVYELPAGSRVYQAIEASGGLTDEAAADAVNQAACLEDGQRLYIPSAVEVQAGEELSSYVMPDGLGEDGTSRDGRVNLNKASREELMTLSGIGEKKAEAIIRYRQTGGGFHSVEELMQVEGIKEGTYEKIKDEICI